MSKKTQCCYIFDKDANRDFIMCDENGQCVYDADYCVWDGLEPNYDHITQVCSMHVGDMFTDSGQIHQFYPVEWEQIKEEKK